MPTILQQNSATPGVLVWKMTWGSANAIAAINTSDSDTMPANFATGLPAGTVLTSEVAAGAPAVALIVAANGTAAVSLPPRSACVWLAGSGSQ